MQRLKSMRYSINGPLPGSLPVVLVVEKYIKLLRTIDFIKPSKSLFKLFEYSTGFSKPVCYGENLSFSDMKEFYKFRIKGNTQAYIRTLCEYINARLNMLNDIPQGRQTLDLDVSKSVKYYYNLSKHSVEEILNLHNKITYRGGLDERDFFKLTSRIKLESMMTFNQMGMISPNPRCDEAVKTLLTSVIPELLRLSSKLPKQSANYAELLEMCSNIARLYYGAVNTRDRDPQMSDNTPVSYLLTKGDYPLHIGNDVVACLPAPTIDMLRSFDDDTAQIISAEATDYVSFLENSYLRRL